MCTSAWACAQGRVRSPCPSSHSFLNRVDALGTLCQWRSPGDGSGSGAARLGVIILHPFLGVGDIICHSQCMATGSCLSFRYSREHPCVCVGREHGDHIRGTHPRCCRVQSLDRAMTLLQEKAGRAGL